MAVNEQLPEIAFGRRGNPDFRKTFREPWSLNSRQVYSVEGADAVIQSNSRRSSKGLPPAEGLWKSGGRVTRVAKRAGGGNRISKYLQPDYWLRIVSEYPVIRPAICGKGQTERAIDGERWRDRRGLSGAHSL